MKSAEWVRFLRTSLPLTLILATASLTRAASEAFFGHWSDGTGEVNTYEISEDRYGQARLGHAVLVYVAEELNRHTNVKVESDRTPVEDRMFVIKLNKLLKFPTGIYDYSSMTSVFSVADSHLGHPPFQAARVVHSSQEWCGQAFARLDLTENAWKYQLRSYFEAEGDENSELTSEGTDLEDNLWVRVRELDGPWLKQGETRSLRLYPALWEARKSHRSLAANDATVTKGETETYSTALGDLPVTRWSWKVEDREVTVWVERDGARRLVGWEDNRGGQGRLVQSERLPYWRLNSNSDKDVRRRFSLPGHELEPGF